MKPRIIDNVICNMDGDEIGTGTLDIGSQRLVWDGGNSHQLTISFDCIRKYSMSQALRNKSCFEATFECHTTAGKSISCLVFVDEVSFDILMDTLLLNVDLDPAPNEPIEPPTEPNTPLVHFRDLRTHVTCLRFVNGLLFAGVGDTLHVFAKTGDQWKRAVTKRIFHGQNIYGIECNGGSDLIVFGGRTFSLLRYFTAGNTIVRLIFSFHTQDWIIDCSWLEGKRQIVLLTANNALLRYDLRVNNAVLSAATACCERCILYSGKLLNKRWHEIIVLAGTVFATIIVWSNEKSASPKEVIHQLTGHKGVIFSITFCERNQLICSTSDDRTVRVWGVDFGGLDNSKWHASKISLKHSLYGHLARVWKSCFSGNQIVTVGEDSRVCVWNLDGSLNNQWESHQGGEVWSLDYCDDHQLVTGGSDGGIIVWPLQNVPIAKILPFSHEGSVPRCVGLSRTGLTFMVSDNGNFFIHDDKSWKWCMKDLRFSSYCLQATSTNRTLVAFASISGCLLICRFSADSMEKIMELSVCKGRIFSLLWLTESSLVVCESDGVMHTWDLCLASNLCQRGHQYILPPSKERWITSAAANNQYFVCGDRGGSLFLYSVDKNTPIYILKKVHGHNGVTDVKIFQGKVLSTGRDGKYRELMIKDGKLLTVTCCKLKLDWAAAIVDVNAFKRVLICFHDVFMIIWSIDERRPILKIDCGGGHRSWDFIVEQSTNCVFIVYIKGKSVYSCRVSVDGVRCQTVQPGGHPKAINAATIIPAPRQKFLEHYLLLGGEDTTVRCVNIGKSSQTQLNVLQSHLSSVRAITCFTDPDEGNIFIGTGGGRGQLVLWQALSIDDTKFEIVELISYCVMNPALRKNEDRIYCDIAEMRVMDLQLYQIDKGLLGVVVGCSDGVLRFLSYNVETNCVNVMRTINLDYCVLKVLFVPWDISSYVICTTTSGMLQLFQTSTEPPRTEYCFVVSDSGINSCDHQRVGDHLVISCAGDSAILHMLLLHFDSTGWQLNYHWKNSNVHSCQVSGMKMVNDRLFAVGLDQVLSVFSWELIGSRLEVSLLKTVTVSVPDIHGILAWHKSSDSYVVFIYGLGSQLLQISSTLPT